MKYITWVLMSLLALPVQPALAQSDSGETGLAAPPTTPAEKLLTVDLNNAPIRDALKQIFTNTGQQYVLDEGVNGYVTLKVSGQPLENILKLVLRASTVPMTYKREKGVYIIQPRQPLGVLEKGRIPRITLDVRDASLRGTLEKILVSANVKHEIAPEVTGKVTAKLRQADLHLVLNEILHGTPYEWYINDNAYYIGAPAFIAAIPRTPNVPLTAPTEVIRIKNMSAADLLKQLMPIRPDGIDHLILQASTNSLLAFSSEQESLQKLRERIQLLDVQSEQVTLKAEIVRIDERATKTVLFSTTIQARPGTASTISEKAMGTSSTINSIKITLTPTRLSNQLEVTSVWELSLPMTGTKGEAVRLEKGLTTTTLLQPMESTLVGETKRNQNGIKDQLRLLLTWTTTAPGNGQNPGPTRVSL